MPCGRKTLVTPVATASSTAAADRSASRRSSPVQLVRGQVHVAPVAPARTAAHSACCMRSMRRDQRGELGIRRASRCG